MIQIRKLLTRTEEIATDGGRAAKRPVRKVAAVAVIEDPFAGRFVEDLTPLIDADEELGALLAKRATAALGGAAESYDALPKADVMPALEISHLETPSPRMPGGSRAWEKAAPSAHPPRSPTPSLTPCVPCPSRGCR